MLLKDKLSGILLHITSLPSPYGIGTLGADAFRFVDFLRDSGQTYWQILPIHPVGSGNSPYQSPSAFAGNELLIDLDLLTKDGLLENSDLINAPKGSAKVNYNLVYKHKIPLLKKAAKKLDLNSDEFLKFCSENESWLYDYAAFMTLKEINGGRAFYRLNKAFKIYNKQNIEALIKDNTQIYNYYLAVQFLFFKQWYNLKKYANKNGVYIVGDIPFYVSLDSADVWRNPELFAVDKNLTPTLVAGVPPDVFSSDGQLWGNPIYNWENHKKQEYAWWISRMAHCARLYDVIRIDHFRAFSTYYTVPYGEKTARNGEWKNGVGYPFFKKIHEALGDIKIIAEDLGELSSDVPRLIKRTGYPNMKVLQFAFDGNEDNPFLPKNYNRNCVCYTGTHDNNTTNGWYESAQWYERENFERNVPNLKDESPAIRLIRYAVKSKAHTVIIPMQDFLELPEAARTNMPGTASGNWRWRLKVDDLSSALCKRIKNCTKPRSNHKNTDA